ncbi:hypothetical protein MIND_01223300 [Mycena indigotica]|uniref:F-box domain-containing protein n=1 Tax=Mycena indigotica TaxID=2126181 RepID=A0A8H6VU36_9AGAR|nr:uncharacterized protein MIND_01223300 [Mycena indigotica]KAF7291976.1 hypothetical protein MIND_01223300 [Mycena indigotica]
MSTDLWSTLPPEISIQIANHNAEDVDALRAMRLVSKEMRDVATKALFSALYFASPDDIQRWLLATEDLPFLVSAVRKLRLSIPLDGPPALPRLENVEEVIWFRNQPWNTDIATTYMQDVFPAATRLSFLHVQFEDISHVTSILRSSNPLNSLTFQYCTLASYARPTAGDVYPRVDWSQMNVARICGNSFGLEAKALPLATQLFSNSRPLSTALQQLSMLLWRDFYNVSSEDSNGLPMQLILLRYSVQSLTHLAINPNLGERWGLNDMLNRTLKQFPPFDALLDLTIHFGRLGFDSSHAEAFFDALPLLPRLSTLRFVFRLTGTPDDYKWFKNVFAWKPTALTQASLQERCPNIANLVWVFRVAEYVYTQLAVTTTPCTSDYRLGIERLLSGRLEEIGVCDLFPMTIEWLDGQHNPLIIED